MSDHELHTLTGAYATDALDVEERAAFERHLESCASCRQEVVELRATASRLATATSSAAPSAMRQRVLAEASRTRQLSPLGPVTALDEHRDRSAPPWYRQPATAAAAVLLVVAAGLGVLAVQQSREADQAQRLAAQIAAVAADPDHAELSAPVSSGGTGTIVAADGIAVFHGSGLPQLPDGQAYQLWRVTDEHSQSAGVLGRGGELTGVLTDMGPDDAVGVTVEPESGSDQPTSEPVFLVSMA